MDIALEKKLLAYKHIALEKLENILLTIFGKKDLVIEADLIKILDSFATMTWLKSKGFDKIFKLTSSPPVKTKPLVFIISANLITFKHVLDQINYLQTRNPLPEIESIKEYHIIVIPNLIYSCKALVESEGLEGIVALYRFSWDWVKIDSNLLSLELPQMYQDIFVKRDKTLLSAIASSIRIFNMVHKKPNVIFSLGENSDKILSMVSRMENWRRSASSEPSEYSDFNAMIIMDRDKDYPSCLLTPVTYSGLMVELFDIKAGNLSIDPENNKIKSGRLEIFNDRKEPSETDKEIRNLRICGTSDELYTYNKYRHFSEVVNLIKSESKNLEEQKNKYSRDMNIDQMKDFVETNLPKVAAQKKVLFKHLIMCEQIVLEMSKNFERQQNFEELILRNGNKKQILSYIDEQLHTNPHKWNTLRLLCLVHICIGSLTTEEVNRFIATYLNTFGHKHLEIFQNLYKAKLFPEILQQTTKNLLNISSALPKKTQFQIDAAKLKLIPDGTRTIAGGSKEVTGSKVCASYVFNGNYIPLIAQIANILLKSESFTEIGSKMSHIEGIKVTGQKIGEELKALKDVTPHENNIFPLRPRTLFIFIVGGITFAEIAACNMIESLTGSRIVLSSNAIISGHNIIQSASI